MNTKNIFVRVHIKHSPPPPLVQVIAYSRTADVMHEHTAACCMFLHGTCNAEFAHVTQNAAVRMA